MVQHLQSQAAEEMGYLAKESQREAIAMRVIAVVTALFLPATFVWVGARSLRNRSYSTLFFDLSLTELDIL